MVLSSLHTFILCLLLPEVSTDQRIALPNPDCDPNITGSLDQQLQNIITDNIVICLTSGIHCLLNPSVVQSVSSITLVGPGQENSTAVITCTRSTGLAFLNVSRLHLENLQVQGCGLTADSLMQVVDQTRQLVQLNFNVPNDTQVAVYMANVTDLYMARVTITNTTGLGLVGINVIGESEIQSCVFSYNTQQQQDCVFTGQAYYVTDLGERIGGGAYFLFQDSVNSTCQNSGVYSLQINDSYFLGNSECSNLVTIEVGYRNSRQAKRDGYSIGGGGGLGIMFAQVCYAINVTTTSTVFEANSAIYGSAAHIGIFQGVSNSNAVFDDCKFTRNGYKIDALNINFTTNGGAIGVFNDLASTDSSVPLFIPNRNISLMLKDSNFTDNEAFTGGAVIITSLVNTVVAELTDVPYFYLDNCVFTGNTAVHGAAALIQELKFHAQIPGIQVRIRDLTVSTNRLISMSSITPLFNVDNIAVFEVRAINITLSGNCLFDSNIGTALQGVESIIGIAGDVKFINNTGLYGGAMNLIEFSYLIVLPNSSLEFTSNHARIYGGALYINQVVRNPFLLQGFDCFLYFNYDQFEYCDTCSFTATQFSVRFTNNTADISAGTIYGSALMSCPWSISLQEEYSNLNVLQVLGEYFSDHFVFIPDPTGLQNVQTPIARVEIEDKLLEYTVAPGETASLALRLLDALGQNITGILGSYPSLDQDTRSSFIGKLGTSSIVLYVNTSESTSLTTFGEENDNGSLIIFALDLLGTKLTLTSMQVQLTECPIGFEYSPISQRCECSPELLERGVQCSSSELTLSVPSGMWVGPLGESHFAVAFCIRGLCQQGGVTMSVRNNMIDFDQQCRQGLRRGGLLCSSCQRGYSNVFGGVQCLKCANSSAAILLLFLALGILVIAFLVLFQVNLSNGYLNGILFWSNIVSLYHGILVPKQSHSAITFLANWLTLNWGIETCFHDGMSALERSWWQLSFSIYLFFLMILIRSLFKSKCCRNVSSKTAFSTIQAIATLIIMCYISILQFCFELISFVHIYTDDEGELLRWMFDPTIRYFKSAHGILAFVACLLLVLYILPFPIIFLSPTLLYKSKWLQKYKPIYDAFWNPYKPRYRFWLGVRLIFRWVLFIMVFFTRVPTSTFVSAIFLSVLLFLQMQLQPFQSKWTNALDSGLLLNLLCLFLGSLFFNAADDDDVEQPEIIRKRASDYSSALIAIAYIVFGAVFVCHLFIRFPKLKGCLLKCVAKCRQQKKKIVLRVPRAVLEDSRSVSGDVQGDGSGSDEEGEEPKLRVVQYTSFRESLLDEGSVEIETYTTRVPATPNNDTN